MSQQALATDLNNDKKLDLISNGAVYLGNGDGTFQQIPFPLGGVPLAVADLNGDGIRDVVMGSTLQTPSGPTGDYVYAGNGNGTFQASPFYTVPLQYVSPVSASVSDLNADGHPDLLLQYSTVQTLMRLALRWEMARAISPSTTILIPPVLSIAIRPAGRWRG